MTFDIARGAETLRSRLGLTSADRYAARVIGHASSRRLVVEYQFEPRKRAFIGKFHADGAGLRAYAALRQIRGKLESDATLAVPDALFYDRRAHFLAQQRVEGVAYADLRGVADMWPYFVRAGQALRDLHTRRVGVGRGAWMSDHIRDLIHPNPRALGRRWPEYRASIERVLAELLERENQFRGEVQPAPIHRDFHLRQLFWDPRRVWVIDFDLFALGDPALDVGNFLVYLETHLAPDASASAREAFLHGYAIESDEAMQARLPVYQGFTWLRLACKSARLRADGWRELTSHRLRQAEIYLDVWS